MCMKQNIKFLTCYNILKSGIVEHINNKLIKPITKNTVVSVTHGSSSHETNFCEMASKANIQFLYYHRLYDSVHMHFHPGFRLMATN